MEFSVSKNIIIWQKYNPLELSMQMPLIDSQGNDQELLQARWFGYNPTRIWIKDTWYNAIPLHELYYMKNEVDGYYRFIYIQINMSTLEYYVGKVNRKRWNELKRYQGSGLKFKSKYKKHSGDFVRYFIAACHTAKESEELEAKIVDDVLLSDEKCLNLVRGGGGTNEHNTSEEKKQHQREYMIEHPEQFQSMVKTAKDLYCSGPTEELVIRNEKIKETMSADKYREMTRERIKRWKEEYPEEYNKARENNRRANQTEESRNKRRESRKKWIQENPEEYAQIKHHVVEVLQSKEVREKRKQSLKEWNRAHPEEAQINARKRSEASAKKCRKAVNMLDYETGEVLKHFESLKAAATWLVENNIAKNTNCTSSIGAVCSKKESPTGRGYRKKAYGYKWEFSAIEDTDNG